MSIELNLTELKKIYNALESEIDWNRSDGRWSKWERLNELRTKIGEAIQKLMENEECL